MKITAIRRHRRAASLLATACLLLSACSAARQDSATEVGTPVEPRPPAPIDAAALTQTMSDAVQLPTISARNPEAFAELKKLLARAYPRTFATLQVEENGPGSLLLTWQGSDASLAPYLLLAHLDVVPVEAGTEGLWEHPPFSGAVADGYIWGRGTLDCKATAVAILAGIESLIESGFKPTRTLVVAFGDDEEIGGRTGAAVLSEKLAQRGLSFLFTLDEGMVIGENLMPGLDRPAAIIGVAEKGYMTVRLSAPAAGGHSSMPPHHTAAGRLAAALVRLENNPMPASLEGTPRAMLEAIGPHLGGVTGAAIAALPLSEGIVLGTYRNVPALDAQVRTTTAITMLDSGTKENVLPQSAQAIVNFRLRPGDTPQDVETHIRETIEDDGITIERVGVPNEASPVADTASAGYRLVARTILELYPDVIVVPGLVLGGTDTRHYVDNAEASLRFGPMRLGRDDLARVHGTNERIAADNLVEMAQFYRRVIENADDWRRPAS